MAFSIAGQTGHDGTLQKDGTSVQPESWAGRDRHGPPPLKGGPVLVRMSGDFEKIGNNQPHRPKCGGANNLKGLKDE